MRIAYLARVNSRLNRTIEHLRLQNDRLAWLTGYHLDLIQELKNGEVEKWLKDERERNGKLVVENAELKRALEGTREIVGERNQLIAENRELKNWLEQYRALSSQLIAEKAELKKANRDTEEMRQLKTEVEELRIHCANLQELNDSYSAHNEELEQANRDIQGRFEKTRELVGELGDIININCKEISRLITENIKLKMKGK